MFKCRICLFLAAQAGSRRQSDGEGANAEVYRHFDYQSNQPDGGENVRKRSVGVYACDGNDERSVLYFTPSTVEDVSLGPSARDSAPVEKPSPILKKPVPREPDKRLSSDETKRSTANPSGATTQSSEARDSKNVEEAPSVDEIAPMKPLKIPKMTTSGSSRGKPLSMSDSDPEGP